MITLNGWHDENNFTRTMITQDVLMIMANYFHINYIFQYPLTIQYVGSVSCPHADDNPCTHYDRSHICITVPDRHWCQFVHQLSHEICHCSTSRITLPQSIKWFDEFLCCFSSYFVENYLATSLVNSSSYMFGDNCRSVFAEYVQIIEPGHIYSVPNMQAFFASNYPRYFVDENLIKKHDVFFRTFYKMLDGEYDGLLFIGKIHTVSLTENETIHTFLDKLKSACSAQEIKAINLIEKIFGI